MLLASGQDFSQMPGSVFGHAPLGGDSAADLGSGCEQDCLDLLAEAATWISGWKMMTKMTE